MAGTWIEVTLKARREAVDILADFLEELGAKGVSIDDPLIHHELKGAYLEERPPANPGGDSELIIHAYYHGDDTLGDKVFNIKKEVKRLRQYVNVGSGRIELRRLNEKDWEHAWKAYYKPIKIGSRLVICPSWEEYQAGPEEIKIILDPGMAFGTGLHPTTRMCLQALEDCLTGEDRDISVLDVGAGSGILSIAAAKLGASSVFAADIDPMAVQICRENALLNQVADKVSAGCGDLLEQCPKRSYSIICANIITDVILRLIPRVVSYLKKGGFFIASGIITDRSVQIKEMLREYGFTLLKENSLDSWVCLAAQKGD